MSCPFYYDLPNPNNFLIQSKPQARTTDINNGLVTVTRCGDGDLSRGWVVSGSRGRVG